MSANSQPTTLKQIIELLDQHKIHDLLKPRSTTVKAEGLELNTEPRNVITEAPAAHKIKASKCPYCHNLLDATSSVCGAVDKRPEAGDISLCIKCAEIVIFGTDLELLKPNFDDWLRIAKEPALERALDIAQRKIKQLKLKDEPI